ncbi:MAG TPA: hypothetical protein VKV96_17340 [Roseiarcus sp.]|nr:hypothetical protein [Roseiarcus sp.]
MLFNLEADTGDRIVCYVVPDGFQGVPRIRVCNAGEELAVLAANETRESLVVASRHETGQCGFSIDASLVPNLPSLNQLELYDEETGILIYRRRAPHMAARKILRLETHLFPLWRLDDALKPSFQYHARGVESLGRETVTQLFLLINVDSVYVSGRILYKNYAYFVESSFQTAILLQEPYQELAERLLVLSKLRRIGAEILGARESMEVEAALEFAEQFPTEDDKAMKRALRQMPGDVGMVFANPLTRLLTATTPDEMPTGGAIAAALDALSSFAVVGLRHESDKFIGALAELIGVEPATLPAPHQFPGVARLAEILKTSGEVDHLLEKDLELYHHVSQAAEKVK